MFRFVIFLVLILTICAEHVQNRTKRTLVWPPGGSKLLAICGFGIPVDLKSRTVIIGTVIKGNYRFPTNASQLSTPVTYDRRKRSMSRWNIYDLMTRVLETRGFEGKPCILRTICEMAQSPLRKNFGLFHELIHKVFTPTSTGEKVNENGDNEYFAAHFFGRKRANCGEIFPECQTSLLDLFTLFK